MTNRSTDVLESIAGYYYQLLIACNELCKLLNAKSYNLDDMVGIEKGSDVKIFLASSGNTSIETKFYKSKRFTRNSYPIVHTIYNYHNSFRMGSKSDKYIFSTNVGAMKEDEIFFLTNWPKDKNNTINAYLTYIKDCIVIESINKEPYLTNFNNFKSHCHTLGIIVPKNKRENSIYLRYLINHLHKINNYNTYSDLMSDTDIKDFISRLEFRFSNRKKDVEVNALKNEIVSNIKTFMTTLNEKDCKIIMDAIMHEIFLTTVTNENVKVNNISIIISNYINDLHSFAEKYNISSKIFDMISAVFEEENQRFDNMLDNYEFLNDIKYSYINIIEKFYDYIQSNKDKDLNKLLERYSLDVYTHPIILTNLSRIISLLSVYGDIDADDITFEDLNGASNIILNNRDKYYYKETLSPSLNTTESLIAAFINKTMSDVGNFIGDETIVFNSYNLSEKESPCNYNYNNFTSIISKISSIKSSIRTQQFYSLLDYRCTRCIDINNFIDDEEVLKQRVCKFHKEKCK